MIDYLVPKFFLGFDESSSVSMSKPSGGMRTKIRSVYKSNASIRLCGSIEEIENEIVLIEPLFFREGGRWNPEGVTKESLVADLLKIDTIKILYCTELEVLRWSGRFLQSVVGMADVITYNCEYQKNLFNMVDLKDLSYLIDPIDTDLFAPSPDPKKPQVIAAGWISTAKNSEFIKDLYTELSGNPFLNTVYVGGPDLWGFGNADSIKLEMGIREAADVYVGSIPQVEFANYLSESAFFVGNSQHDCSAGCHAESISAGCLVVAGGHPIYKERYGHYVKPGVPATLEKLECLTSGWTRLPHPLVFDGARDWAVKNLSFERFNNHLSGIIGGYRVGLV